MRLFIAFLLVAVSAFAVSLEDAAVIVDAVGQLLSDALTGEDSEERKRHHSHHHRKHRHRIHHGRSAHDALGELVEMDEKVEAKANERPAMMRSEARSAESVGQGTV
mmetsp:Transcript_16845/g.39662  ORF Transcript_16845/g.39662 Transcript_16845/m.39662 type:complete len:107 (+) Transcript_16845:70-390(+)